MSNFTEMFRRYADMTTTENGGTAVDNLSNPLLELFARLGGLRKTDEREIISDWKAARHYDKELADNLVLYARNIRDGGLGERRVGRILLKELAKEDPSKVSRNFQTIVDTGRWDDLFVFEGTEVESEMWQFIKEQLTSDVEDMKANKPISLLGKWLPSINTSSNETRRLAKKICVIFGLTPRTYRKTLSALRKYIDVVERKMSSGDWKEINFEGVPSVAMNRYIKTFNAHIPEEFKAYKEALTKGEAKVNAVTLYPYDIIKKGFDSINSPFWSDLYVKFDEVDEAQWKALPNYLENNDDEVLFIVDTSGSMTGDNFKPISTAIGLGVYFAQRNKGAFHNMYMSFSGNPSLYKIKDEWSLEQCVNQVLKSDWGWNTNLDKAFELVYNIALETNDVPKAIVIASDMQIDSWTSEKATDTITAKWQKKFSEFGLTAPKLIYWNIGNSNSTFLGRPEDKVSYISGYGVGSFKFLTNLIDKTAEEAMREILSQDAFCWK